MKTIAIQVFEYSELTIAISSMLYQKKTLSPVRISYMHYKNFLTLTEKSIIQNLKTRTFQNTTPQMRFIFFQTALLLRNILYPPRNTPQVLRLWELQAPTIPPLFFRLTTLRHHLWKTI